MDNDIFNIYNRTERPPSVFLEQSESVDSAAPLPRVHLLTFSGGANVYRKQVIRLCGEAKALEWFDTVIGLTDEDRHSWVDELFELYGEFIDKNNTGFGLWVWKPFLVNKALESIPEGDLLLYVDSGCEFSVRGGGLFRKYLRFAEKYEALFWEIPFIERQWTSSFVFDNIDPKRIHAETGQIQATWFLLKRTNRTLALTKKWLQMATLQQCALLVGHAISEGTNSSFMAKHRQDQSLLSLLCKQEGFPRLPWQDRFSPWLYVKNSWVLQYPVHARRCKGRGRVFKMSQESAGKSRCLGDIEVGIRTRFMRAVWYLIKLLRFIRDMVRK